MITKHIGQIFNPVDHLLCEGNVGFAQSPQLLEFDDFVRIYFCTRTAESNGMFQSHVAYADMKKDLSEVMAVSRHEVVPPGDLGTFDEHGIFPFNVIRVQNQIWGYTCGWNRRVSVAVDTGVGLVVSNDEGKTFRRLGPGPILGPSLHEPFLVGDAFVIEAEGKFHMWYMFGQRWVRESEASDPDRVYKIGYADSQNGIDWNKHEAQPVLPDVMGAYECQALPSVMEYGGAYHMVFCYRHVHNFRTNSSKGYRLGYAKSTDLVTWKRDDDALGLRPDPDDWDGLMQCYPHLCQIEGVPHLLYNGNAFGRDGFGAARLALDAV